MRSKPLQTQRSALFLDIMFPPFLYFTKSLQGTNPFCVSKARMFHSVCQCLLTFLCSFLAAAADGGLRGFMVKNASGIRIKAFCLTNWNFVFHLGFKI